MIAITKNDKCFSTALNGRNPFNTDGVERTELPVELARTGLDFTIVKRPSFDEYGRQLLGQYHLERDDEEHTFIPTCSIGGGFHPIQHSEVFDYITQEVMPQVPEMKLEMAGTIRGGAIGLIAAKFGDAFGFDGDESPSELRLLFNNPCGYGSMTLGYTTVRVVCQNTLLAATREAKTDGWRISHTANAQDKTRTAVESIRSQLAYALEMKKRCEALSHIAVNGAMLERMLDAVYSYKNLPEGHIRTHLINLREKVVEQFQAGETAQTFTKDNAWKALNAFTYPIIHEKTSYGEKKKMDEAAVAYKGMIGDGAKKVLGILRKVEAIAYAA